MGRSQLQKEPTMTALRAARMEVGHGRAVPGKPLPRRGENGKGEVRPCLKEKLRTVRGK